MSQSSKKPPDTTFKENQQVVYPLQGVGQVQSIESIDFPKDGNPVLYYIIYLPVSDMTVKVPVDKAEELGIRAIVPKEEAERALNLFTEEYEPVPADWKMRYQMNLDLLKQGSVIDIATVVRTLYHRKKVKELPILERKLYDSALKLLIDEVSFSLDVSKEEVEEMIFSKLEVEAEREEEEEEEAFEEEDDIDVDLDEDEE
jgi:CarD family transcriptional regulator